MERNSGSLTPSGPSQPSTGNTPQTTVSTGQSTQGQPTPTAANATNSKRRRGLGIVTPNACTECRKKRAKCDGRRPCGRCKAQKDAKCVYEIPVRQSKQNMRGEIETLRNSQRCSNTIFAALVQPNFGEEVLRKLRQGEQVENISEWLNESAGGAHVTMATTGDREFSGGESTAPLGTIVTAAAAASSTLASTFGTSDTAASLILPTSIGDENSSTLVARLPAVVSNPWQVSRWPHSQAESTRSGSYPDILRWEQDPRGLLQSRARSWAEGMHAERTTNSSQRYRELERVLSPFDESAFRSPPVTWTTITNDINLVHHLLALYFCWEYPTFASLSKEHFLRDFQAGRNRYCSPILVNALLALGCRFSSHPMTKSDPDNPYTSGNHFFKEAQRLFNLENDHHSLTTIQAVGIMSIREASCGRDSESWFYTGQSIRLAIEMGLHCVDDEDDEDELAVRSATFWGAFALDHAWSLATGSLPQCSRFPQLPPKPAIIDDIEASVWVVYTDDGAPPQRSCEQSSNVRSVYKCFCELSELVHRYLYILHSPGKPLTARDLLSIYRQYLNWYDRIPEVLRLGHNFTPAVLFAHMYYHFAILLLFRPLIKLRIIGSKVLPQDVCSQAADAIQGLLASYSQLYTLQRTPSFVPYFVLTSTIMHLAIAASLAKTDRCANGSEKIKTATTQAIHVVDTIKTGIVTLTEMATCHHFADQVLNILQYLAHKWNIHVAIKQKDEATTEQERLGRSDTTSLNFFAPSINTRDFICHWGGGDGEAESDELPGGTDTAEDRAENPPFWPFPLQGKPLLPSGRELEQAGFALL